MYWFSLYLLVDWWFAHPICLCSGEVNWTCFWNKRRVMWPHGGGARGWGCRAGRWGCIVWGGQVGQGGGGEEGRRGGGTVFIWTGRKGVTKSTILTTSPKLPLCLCLVATWLKGFDIVLSASNTSAKPGIASKAMPALSRQLFIPSLTQSIVFRTTAVVPSAIPSTAFCDSKCISFDFMRNKELDLWLTFFYPRGSSHHLQSHYLHSCRLNLFPFVLTLQRHFHFRQWLLKPADQGLCVLYWGGSCKCWY